MKAKQILTAAVATGAGSVSDADKTQSNVGFQVDGITPATVTIQGSYDGTNWFNLITPVTADAVGTLTTVTPLIRANVTAWTAGTINVFLGVAS